MRIIFQHHGHSLFVEWLVECPDEAIVVRRVLMFNVAVIKRRCGMFEEFPYKLAQIIDDRCEISNVSQECLCDCGAHVARVSWHCLAA